MTDRTQFEQMLEALINEDQQTAKDIFHNIVVAKSREIYEELLESDFDPKQPADADTMEEKEEDTEDDFSDKDETDDQIDDVEADDSEDDFDGDAEPEGLHRDPQKRQTSILHLLEAVWP